MLTPDSFEQMTFKFHKLEFSKLTFKYSLNIKNFLKLILNKKEFILLNLRFTISFTK